LFKLIQSKHYQCECPLTSKSNKQEEFCCFSKLTLQLDYEMSFLLYSFLMFRHLSQLKRLLGLLLPFTFLWGWAACLWVCAESAVPPFHEYVSAAQTIEPDDDNCTDELDVCTIMTAVAVNQERQTVEAFAQLRGGIPVSKFLSSPSPWDALLREVNQNSPPTPSFPPLFVRLCTFRI
jgi:hypothetical protein